MSMAPDVRCLGHGPRAEPQPRANPVPSEGRRPDRAGALTGCPDGGGDARMARDIAVSVLAIMVAIAQPGDGAMVKSASPGAARRSTSCMCSRQGWLASFAPNLRRLLADFRMTGPIKPAKPAQLWLRSRDFRTGGTMGWVRFAHFAHQPIPSLANWLRSSRLRRPDGLVAAAILAELGSFAQLPCVGSSEPVAIVTGTIDACFRNANQSV